MDTILDTLIRTDIFAKAKFDLLAIMITKSDPGIVLNRYENVFKDAMMVVQYVYHPRTKSF